jgi:hypothetical protein
MPIISNKTLNLMSLVIYTSENIDLNITVGLVGPVSVLLEKFTVVLLALGSVLAAVILVPRLIGQFILLSAKVCTFYNF